MQQAIAFIRKSALKSNLSSFSSLVGEETKIFAVVKANAYGHGAEEVASLLEPFVFGFCVSLVSEGAALRVSGVQKPILVLTPPTEPFEALCAKEYGLTLTAANDSSLQLCLSSGAPYHFAVNTGMNRYGFTPEECKALFRDSSRFSKAEGIYSHLFLASNKKVSREQKKRFEEVCSLAENSLSRPLLRHLAATGGMLLGKEYHFDAVRLGLGLYGYLPNMNRRNSFRKTLKLEKAMFVFAPVVQAHEGKMGGAGYGKGKGKSTVRFGYGDGLYQRAKKGKNGLCMDAFVSEKSLAGNFPVLLDAEKEARKLKTTPYEILCSFGERVERRYVE